MTNRTSLKSLALAAVAVATGLTACSKKAEPAPAPAPVAAPAPARPAPLKAAFVYVGPVGDAGYTYAHDLGRKEAVAKLGDKVTTKVVWVGSWFDPPKETEAAQTLLNKGADVLLQNTDSTAVLQAAEKAGKYAFGWDSDMSAFAPRAHLGSCVLLWGVYYEKALNDVLDKTWKTGETKWGHREGMTDFIKIPDFVPADAKKKVEEAKAGLKAGTLDIFKGPIVDNTGKVRLAKGVAADDKWLGSVDFYVKGVEGKVQGGK